MSRNDDVIDISPTELREKLLRQDDFQFIDVREQFEWNESHIDGARLIPMGRIVSEVGSLDKDREVVLYCRTGARSWRVAEWLVSQGFKRVANLDGGIMRWEQEEDGPL